VSAYVEVGSDTVEAFVRDHGTGFDVDTVPEDRLGVRESIIGRMRRHGGTARLRRLEDGTEVALSLPVSYPVSPDVPPVPGPARGAAVPAPAPPDGAVPAPAPPDGAVPPGTTPPSDRQGARP
jgi:hypothetical protein